MRPRSSSVLGPHVSEEESRALACASAQGRRRAARAQSQANLHKVGCSWSARPIALLREGSAGPTTPPRFEPSRSSAIGRQTGEPTVSHEGGNALDSSSTCSSRAPVHVSEKESRALACASAQERRRAARAQSQADLHKVGCSWSAGATGSIPDGSAGPTTPPRFEPSGIDPVAPQTGEPTVSHEGGNALDSFSTFSARVSRG
jgi:hypothetical protein